MDKSFLLLFFKKEVLAYAYRLPCRLPFGSPAKPADAAAP
jgi:hypothetical protein